MRRKRRGVSYDPVGAAIARSKRRQRLARRADENTEKYGTIEERRERVRAYLATHPGLHAPLDIAGAVGLKPAMVGDALGHLREQKLADRRGGSWQFRPTQSPDSSQ